MEGVAFPRRGDTYWAKLDPTVGPEIAKTRPALVVSNDVGNRFSAVVTIAPLTTGGGERVYPFEVPVARGEGGVARASRVLLNQIRTVDKRRLENRVGALPADRMLQVDVAIRLSLAV
jgi:mRNA interferase MazF